MNRRRHLVRAASLALLAPVIALAIQTDTAVADPTPGIAERWPYCGEAPDDDDRYCIASVTRNGVAVPSDTTAERAYIDLIGAAEVRFGVENATDPSNGEVDPAATWRLVVHTGSIEPWAIVDAVARDVEFSPAGSGSNRRFTLEFRPLPIAHTTSMSCHWDSGCGDDSTVADLVYDGFVTGYVTDGATTLGAGLRPFYEGFVSASSAQEALVQYDEASNSLILRLANPHLKAPGVPAVGAYETFMPDAYLIGLLGVPDPAGLRGGSFVVTRSGSSTNVPFSVSREPGGVRLRIPTIPFSTPTYKVRAKPTPPGKPRGVKVLRDGRAVKVTFKKPLADGGKRIQKYVARCRIGRGAWQTGSAATSPIRIALPRGSATCQVRAVNTKGVGPWSQKATG